MSDFNRGGEVKVKTIGDSSIVKATISESKFAKLFDLLQNPYSDNISSIVREITSNCVDAHRDAGIDDPILITMGVDPNGYFIKFEDFGVGMSHEFITTTYSRYLDSTKEEDDNQIGYFGIGSKSPLSYTSEFFLRTRKDGMECEYVVRKDSDGIPVIQKVFSVPSDEPNGTEVCIYLLDYSDISNFEKAINVQLQYFDNVYVETGNLIDVENDYTIYEGKYFKLRDNSSPDSPTHSINHLYDKSKETHICIGNVYYPINWRLLNMDAIKWGFAVKFDIKELDVTMTRETLKYTPKTIERIKERLKQACQEIASMIEDANTIDDPRKYIKSRGSHFIELNGHRTYIGNYPPDLHPEVKVPGPKFTGFDGFLQKWPHLYKFFYPFESFNCNRKIAGKKWIQVTEDIEGVLCNTSNKIIRISSDVNRKKNEYIGSVLKEVYFVRQRKKSLRLYKGLLNLSRIPKDKWRECIQDYQSATEQWMIENSIRYEDIKVPYSYYIKSKPSEDNIDIDNPFGILESEIMINYKQIGQYTSNKYKQSLADLRRIFRGYTVITVPVSSLRARDKQHLWGNLGKANKLYIIEVSKTNVELLSKYESFIPLAHMYVKTDSVLGNAATAHLIKAWFQEVSQTDSLSYYIEDEYEDEIRDELKKLTKFLKANDVEYPSGYRGTHVKLINSMIKMAIKSNTMNWGMLHRAELAIKLYSRYGKGEHTNMSDKVKEDIALGRKRILPLKYYKDVYFEARLEKENPTTVDAIGFSNSLINRKPTH